MYMTMRIFAGALCALALLPGAASAATCAGPNPSITSVVVKNVTNSGTVDVYHLSGTVMNLGSQGQPPNALQFVDIYVDTVKRDDRGIPPLAAGKSYTFGYDWTRSADAGRGTTTIRFRLDMRQGSNCNPSNGSYSITF
jgi:hypothetical protein